jgi:hypothetical protein
MNKSEIRYGVESWTLVDLWINGTPMSEIKEHFQRTESAVLTKLWKIVTDYREEMTRAGFIVREPTRTGKPWSVRESQLLLMAVTGAKDAKNRPEGYRPPPITLLASIFQRDNHEMEQETAKIRGGHPEIKREGFF